MNGPWKGWTTKPPSPDFTARVARAARRDYVARRARKVTFGVSALALAAGAALFVRHARLQGGGDSAASGPDEGRIRPDELRLAPGMITWPLARGWSEEVFDFPLPFAPKLSYHGTVPLHFSPTFGKPGTPGYWSYVPIWVRAGIEGNTKPDPRQLEEDLRDYYTGLCHTSGHPATRTRSETVTYEAHLTPAPLDPKDEAVGATWSFRGDLQAVDCIVTGDQLALSVEAVAGACGEKAAFVAYTISPRPSSDPIWEELRADRRRFDCRHPATPAEITALTTVPSAASVTIPDTAAGRALTWVLSALSHVPTEAEITERFAPSFLEKISAHELAEDLLELGAAYSPPVVAEISAAAADTLVVRVRSGNREAPLLGREIRLSIGVDPNDPTHISSLRVPPSSETDAPAHTEE
jgi:ORF 12 gene product N-terminal